MVDFYTMSKETKQNEFTTVKVTAETHQLIKVEAARMKVNMYEYVQRAVSAYHLMTYGGGEKNSRNDID